MDYKVHRENAENETTGASYRKAVNCSQNELLREKRSSELLFENLIWLSSKEAAEYLRLPSVGALRVLVCKRRVPFHKLGRSLRFKRCDLDRLLETSRNGGL